jgi:hypothetical protein
MPPGDGDDMPLGDGDSAMGGETESNDQSNSAFNGLLRGHSSMLRGDQLQGHRADLNNFVNGVARVASFRDERVLGGPRKDLPQPDGLGSQGFGTPRPGARRSGARNEAGQLVNVTTGNVRKTRTPKPLAEGAPPKPKRTRTKSTVPGLTVAGAPRQVRTKRSLSEGDTESTQNKTPGVNKDGSKRRRGSGGARVKGKSVPVTEGSETGGHGGDSEGAWKPAPLSPVSFRVASHGGSKHACPFV